MRIGFNCLHIIPGRLGGLESYLHSLLADVGKTTMANEFVIFCSRQYASVFDKYKDRFTVVELDVNPHSTPRRIYYEQFILSSQLPKHKIDVLHSSGYTAPVTRTCKTVMAVHDLNYIEIPKMIRRSHGTMRWAALRLLGPLTMKRADKILTISNHVRHQISRYFHIDPNRIATVYARSPCDFSQLASEPVELPPQLESGFLLYIASWLPHKNHRILFRALAEAKRRGTHLPPLLLAGLHLRSDARRLELTTTVQKYGLEDRVHFLDQHLSLANLAYLYQQARIFVFPSIFEGFGIPVVEAMSAKVPVVVSQVEPLIEIADGNALMFAPDDSNDLLNQLTNLTEDGDLHRRLSNQSYQRYLALKQASDAAGDTLMSVYGNLLE